MHKTRQLPKSENECHLIEIRLNEIRQLFNSLDPAPFLSKDLDARAEEYIVDSMQELHLDTPVKLVLHLPQAACNDPDSSTVPDAIHNYFAYRARIAAKELHFVLRQGRIALLIGIAFLFVCIALQQFVNSLGKSDFAWLILEEGFLISGWVAMWKPLQVFLYDWWPIRARRRIFEKLAQIPVQLQAYP